MVRVWTFFHETFVQSGSGLSILLGLLTTLRISIFSLIFGTLLAVPLCALRMSERRFFASVARGYIALVRGTPVLMLLMLSYYVVFASSRLDAANIAIFAFSLNTAAVVAEIMRTALHAVPSGQTDAARALGMRGFEIFRSLILPQASRAALPVYQSAVINLIQWTSVVGYISITDLTRAINFISSRTMEPLLMLFVGIALYLAMAYLSYGVFALLGRHPFGVSYRYDRKQKP